MRVVLVCGSRDWSDSQIIEELLDCQEHAAFAVNEKLTVIHGAARGADRIAAKWCGKFSGERVSEMSFPARWDQDGKGAGFIRNQRMLDEGEPDVVYAFKDGFDFTLSRGGTEDMVRRAKKAGVRTYVISHP